MHVARNLIKRDHLATHFQGVHGPSPVIHSDVKHLSRDSYVARNCQAGRVGVKCASWAASVCMQNTRGTFVF
jgi:hypothetical protein